MTEAQHEREADQDGGGELCLSLHDEDRRRGLSSGRGAGEGGLEEVDLESVRVLRGRSADLLHHEQPLPYSGPHT